MIKKVMLVVVVAVLFWVNFGFTVQVVDAYDPWAQVWRWQQDGMGNTSWGGAPRGGAGFNMWGYNYWNPYAGPSFPTGAPRCTLGQYDYTMGPPTVGGGFDGYSYGMYVPGSYGLYGMYGYGFANPYHN